MSDMALQKFSDDDSLESSMFQLSFQLLQSKLKNILPFLIGFEIVEKNDDGTKAVGAFGFRSNKGHTLFVPCFYINGQVKNLDLLYSKDHEQFYPLNEEFANLFLKDDAQDAGQPSNETRQSIQADMPAMDMRNMVAPPRTGKYTYASCLDYVKDQNNETKSLLKYAIESNADFCEALLRYYPIEKIAEAITPAERPGKEYRDSGEVRILNDGESFDTKSLAPAEKEELATKGFLVIDKRPDSKKSKFAPVNVTQSFTNPSESGFYPYITKTGEIRYGLVLVRPNQLDLPYATNDAIVVDLDSESSKGQAYIVDNSKLFTKDQIRIADLSDIYKQFEDAASVKPSFDHTYVLINEKLKASVPFKVEANFKDSSGLRKLKVSPVKAYEIEELSRRGKVLSDRPGSIHDLPAGNFFTPPHKESHFYITMTKSSGGRFTYKNNNIYIPAGFKLLSIIVRKPWAVEELVKYDQGKPGPVSSITGILSDRQVYPMTVHNTGSEYFVSVKEFKKHFKNSRTAKIAMVKDLGMDWKQASEVIDGIKPTYKIKGYLKVADLGAYPAQPDEEVPYADEFGTPTYSGVGSEKMAPIDNSYDKDPTRMGLGVKPDLDGINGEIERATQLAESGQKEIFDTHTIATLAKYVNPEDKITEYTPALLGALDKLGRLLFLTHWETDKFTQMYGRDDMPKFVELLTDVFRNLGDVIIFLKRKSPELTINMSQQDVLDS